MWWLGVQTFGHIGRLAFSLLSTQTMESLQSLRKHQGKSKVRWLNMEVNVLYLCPCDLLLECVFCVGFSSRLCRTSLQAVEPWHVGLGSPYHHSWMANSLVQWFRTSSTPPTDHVFRFPFTSKSHANLLRFGVWSFIEEKFPKPDLLGDTEGLGLGTTGLIGSTL